MNIETIDFHPKSGIESWGGWPIDIIDKLQYWNRKQKRLSFKRIEYLGSYKIFKCPTCQKWHRPPGNGVAFLDDVAYCDHCLIILARYEIVCETV